MKAGLEHRVPLSAPVLEVLEEARTLDDGSALVFPSPIRPGAHVIAGTKNVIRSAEL